MNYRFMRMFVFFDLPMVTYSDKRKYREFHTFLLRKGFVMEQQSVYSKLLLDSRKHDPLVQDLMDVKPEKGLVQILTVTEKQYTNIIYLCGKSQGTVLNSKEAVIVL